MRASSARTPPGKSSAWSASPRPPGRKRPRSRWPSSPTRSGLGTRSGHPAGKRVVAAVVRGLVELRLPQLIVAGSAGDHRVPHAPAACRGFPGRCADARLPAHLRPARPQLMTERAAFWLVLEQRNGHLNDHARTGRYASMITVAGSEPVPAASAQAVIRTGCADRSGGSKSKDRMGLGSGGPGTRSGLAVSLAKELMRLSGKFLGTAVVLRSSHCCSNVSRPPGSGRDTTRALVTFLPWHPCHGGRAGHRLRPGQHGRITGPDAGQDVFRRHARSVTVPPRLPSLDRMDTLASRAQQLARALLQEPLPRRWAQFRASPTGPAAWHLFSAQMPISWKPPRGYTTSATRPAWPSRACTNSTAPGTCATPGTPAPSCAGWSPITPAPSSKPKNAGLPTS
jgi:hypothetical protein